MDSPGTPCPCPECGLTLGPGSLGGECPRCALRLALDPESIGAGDLPNAEPSVRNAFPWLFGHYEILGEVARGGMGVVYRARQLGLNRIVALKMVPAHHLLSDEARLRLRVEIEAVSQLNHPHIVPLYESGEHNGAHFFTMRLVEGGDLLTHLGRHPPIRDAVRLLVKVCRAVHYAHQRGILHRDLKPSNILVDLQGEPQVADFGLAKSLDQESGFTFTSTILGSPSYMAPEQAAGGSRQLTTAVDVYGLGAMLYHTLTGHPPFQAPTPVETLRQVMDLDPPAPGTRKSGVDPDLAIIALKCLRKEPIARYGSAEELAQDLERWLNGGPILARPLGRYANAWRWSRRHPLAAGLAFALVVAIAGVVMATSVAAVRVRGAEKRAKAQLANALISEARASRLRGPWAGRRQGLHLLNEAASLILPVSLQRQTRDEMLALLPRFDLVFVPASDDTTGLHPDLTRLDPRLALLASINNRTSLVFRSIPSGEPIRPPAPFTGTMLSLDRFSPDGRFLAVRHTDQQAIVEVSSGRSCWSLPGTQAVFDFSPAATEFVVQEVPNEAVIRELPSGRERRRWRLQDDRPGGRSTGWHTLQYSPDGRTLAGASAISKIVELLDTETGRVTRLLTNGIRTRAMGWNIDGTRFAVASGDGRIYAWDLERNTEPRISASVLPHAHAITFEPSGRHILLAGDDRRLRLIDWEELRMIHEIEAEADRLTYLPDGRRLGPVRVEDRWGWFEIRLPDEYLEFESGVPTSRVMDLRFSPDGRVLLAGNPLQVALCDPEHGTKPRPMPTWVMANTVFQPDTHALVSANSPGILRFHPLTSTSDLPTGPAEVLHPPRRWRALAFTPDGERLAAFNGMTHQISVFDRSLTNQLSEFGPHLEAEDVAISPDGRWVATGSYEDRSVRVWDVAARELVFTDTTGLRPQATFSGDGQWLATFGETFRLRRVQNWTESPPLPFPERRVVPGVAAFSHAGRVLAVVGDSTQIHLFDSVAFAHQGVLRPRENLLIRALAFSSDGTRLAALGAEGRVAIWRLDRIHQVLEQAGIAGDLFPRFDPHAFPQ
jgi:WD40 repeat protein